MFCHISLGCIFRMSVQVLEIIYLCIFQLFLTWMWSAICFTHNSEMAQLRGEWLLGLGKGKSWAAYVGTDAERSVHEMIALVPPSEFCVKWSPTLPHRKAAKINIFTVWMRSDVGQKELEKSRHPVKNHHRQWPLLKHTVFCHSSTC